MSSDLLSGFSSSSVRTRSSKIVAFRSILVNRRQTSVNRLFERLRVSNFACAHFYQKAFGSISIINKAFQEPKNNFFVLHPD